MFWNNNNNKDKKNDRKENDNKGFLSGKPLFGTQDQNYKREPQNKRQEGQSQSSIFGARKQ